MGQRILGFRDVYGHALASVRSAGVVGTGLLLKTEYMSLLDGRQWLFSFIRFC